MLRLIFISLFCLGVGTLEAKLNQDLTIKKLKDKKYQNFKSHSEFIYHPTDQTSIQFKLKVQTDYIEETFYLKKMMDDINSSLNYLQEIFPVNYAEKIFTFHVFIGDFHDTNYGSYRHYSRIIELNYNHWKEAYDKTAYNSRDEVDSYYLDYYFLPSIFAHEYFHFLQFYHYPWSEDDVALEQSKEYRELMAQIFESYFLASLNLESYMMEYFHFFRIVQSPTTYPEHFSRFSALNYISTVFQCYFKQNGEFDPKLAMVWEDRCKHKIFRKKLFREIKIDLANSFNFSNKKFFKSIQKSAKKVLRKFDRAFITKIKCPYEPPYKPDTQAVREANFSNSRIGLSWGEYNSIADNWICATWYYFGDSLLRVRKHPFDIPFKVQY